MRRLYPLTGFHGQSRTSTTL